jgi:hypothetical protein
MMWTVFISPEQSPAAGFCENGVEHSGSIKAGKYVAVMSDGQRLKDCAPSSQQRGLFK